MAVETICECSAVLLLLCSPSVVAASRSPADRNARAQRGAGVAMRRMEGGEEESESIRHSQCSHSRKQACSAPHARPDKGARLSQVVDCTQSIASRGWEMRPPVRP